MVQRQSHVRPRHQSTLQSRPLLDEDPREGTKNLPKSINIRQPRFPDPRAKERLTTGLLKESRNSDPRNLSSVVPSTEGNLTLTLSRGLPSTVEKHQIKVFTVERRRRKTNDLQPVIYFGCVFAPPLMCSHPDGPPSLITPVGSSTHGFTGRISIHDTNESEP